MQIKFHVGNPAGIWPIVLLLLAGCASNFVTVGYQSPGFSTNELKNKKVLLVVSDEITVSEFKKSFENVFGNADSCHRYLSRSIQDSLRTSIPEISMGPESDEFARVLKLDDINPGRLAKTDSLFKSIDANYIIHVKNIAIGNTTKYTPGQMTPAPTGGMMMTGGGTSESCVVSYDVEIWDVAAKQKKMAFRNTGSGQVALFAYGTALRFAFRSSIAHLAGYLRNNQTEFLN